jgi:hypothetical protein
MSKPIEQQIQIDKTFCFIKLAQSIASEHKQILYQTWIDGPTLYQIDGIIRNAFIVFVA